jgi:hypothetical protein
MNDSLAQMKLGGKDAQYTYIKDETCCILGEIDDRYGNQIGGGNQVGGAKQLFTLFAYRALILLHNMIWVWILKLRNFGTMGQ